MKSWSSKRNIGIAQSGMTPLAPFAFLEHCSAMQSKTSLTAKAFPYFAASWGRGGRWLQVHQCTRSLFVAPRTTSGRGQVNDWIVFILIFWIIKVIHIYIWVVMAGKIVLDFKLVSCRCLLFHCKIKNHYVIFSLTILDWFGDFNSVESGRIAHTSIRKYF